MLLVNIGNPNIPAGDLQQCNPYIKFDCSLSKSPYIESCICKFAVLPNIINENISSYIAI